MLVTGHGGAERSYGLCLEDVGAGEVVLFGREGNTGKDGEVTSLVLVEDASKDGGRVKVGDAIAFD